MDIIGYINILVGIYAAMFILLNQNPKPVAPNKRKNIQVKDKRYSKQGGFRIDEVDKTKEEYDNEYQRYEQQLIIWEGERPKIAKQKSQRGILLVICLAIWGILETIPKPKNDNFNTTEEFVHTKIENLGDGWNRFHHRYDDFSLELPNTLEEGVYNLESSGYLKSNNLTSGGTQYYHSENEKIKFDFFASVSTFTSELNKKYFEESYKQYLDDKNVPYKVINDNSYVASGYQDKETIFYRKAFFKNNHTYFLNITYKTNKKKEVEPLLDRIQKSFK